MEYQTYIKVLKALSDQNRLQIVAMLRDGELCACKILEVLSISQPTLSHHMKVLCDSQLVIYRKDGKWQYYSINQKLGQEFNIFTSTLLGVK